MELEKVSLCSQRESQRVGSQNNHLVEAEIELFFLKKR